MTIYDIAKAIGISASTVSRVINNKPGVRKDTRKRVLDYLEKHHYSPNEAARGLVNQASKIIGILIADMRTTHHTEGVYYIEREFEKLGYCCIIMNTGTEESEKARYIELLSQRRVEAAVLIGSTFQCDLVKNAIEAYMPAIPIVIANGFMDLPNIYGVIADEQNGIFNCVRFLVQEKARKNIAFIIDNFTPSNILKQEGYKMGMYQWLNVGKPLIYECSEGMQGGYEATKRLLKDHPETDAIIYVVDLLAVGGLRACKDMKIDVPQQVSIIGVDNSAYAEICSPTLTSLDNNLIDQSVTAVRILIETLQKKRTTRKVIIPSSIVEREST